MAKAINQNDLTGVINSVLGITGTLFDSASNSKGDVPQKLKQLQENYKVILGKDGILDVILANASRLQELSTLKIKNVKKVINVIFDSIETILERLNESKFLSSPLNKNVVDNLKTLTGVFDSIISLTADLKKLALWSALAILVIPLATIGLLLIVGFLKIAALIFSVAKLIVEGRPLQNIKKISRLITAIVNMAWKIVILALLAPVLLLAVPLAIISILLIMGFLFMAMILFKLISNVVTKMIDDVIVGALVLVLVVGAVLMMAISLLVVGLIALALQNLIGPILLFLVSLIAIVVLIGVIGAILTSMIYVLAFCLIGLSLMVVIVGSIFIVAVMLLLIGIIAPLLNKMMPDITDFMTSLLTYAMLLTVLSVAMAEAMPFFIFGTIGLSLMIGMTMSILVISVLLLAISAIKLNEETLLNNLNALVKSTYAISGLSTVLVPLAIIIPFALVALSAVTPLISAVYMLAIQLRLLQAIELDETKLKNKINSIFNCVDTVVENLDSNKKASDLRKQARKNKRMLRQIRKVVDQLAQIGEILEKINDIKIDEQKITKSIDKIWTVVNNVQAFIKDKFSNQTREDRRSNRKSARRAKRELGRVSEVMDNVTSIVDTIKSIKDIKIDDNSVALIKDNLDKIFQVVDNIDEIIEARNAAKLTAYNKGNFLENWWNRRKEAKNNSKAQEKAIEELGKAGELMSNISNIVGTIESIQSIEIDKDKAKTGIENVFNLVDELALIVSERNKPAPGEANADKLAKYNARQAMSENIEIVAEDTSAVGSLMGTIKDILDALNSINNVKKLRKDFIKKTVSGLFDFVDELAVDLSNRMSTSSNGETITQAITFVNGQKGFFDTISSLTETLSKVESISKLNIDKDKVQSLVTWLMIDIPAQLSNGATLYNANISSAVNLALNDMERINEVLSKVESTPETASSYKKIMEANTNFLDKINTVKLENLKTAANIFEQMAKFSESISGDFEGLADTLNDKIAPLMEELKELLDGVQKKVEKSGSDISASVFASKSGQLNSSEMANQTAREMPNSSDAEREQETRRRMEAQARQQNSEIVSKLAELIDLFEDGRARVKPVM